MMKIRKITACFLSAILLTSACVTVFADAEADTEITVSDDSYAAYSENFSDTLAGDETELLLGNAVTNGEKNENGIVLKEEQSVAFNEAIPNGKYKIQLAYTVLEVSSETIEFKLSVDGKYPFSECENLTAYVEYKDETADFAKDSKNNVLPPDLTVSDEAVTYTLKDSAGIYPEAYAFIFDGESHEIKLTVQNGEIRIESVVLVPYKEAVSYKEYLSMQESGSDNTNIISLRAERPDVRTSRSVIPFCDTSSSSAQPAAENLSVMNMLGGAQWMTVGQNAEWNFEVKESGWYELKFKYLQSYTNGRPVYRSVLIDGELPFKEAENITFAYTGKVKEISFSDGEEPYRFYLKNGNHSLTLAVSLGEMTDIIKDCRVILSDINAIYRRIITITGTSPDRYRDYRLGEKLPDVIEKMGSAAKELNAIIERLEGLNSDGTESGSLSRLAIQLERFYNDPDKITVQLSQFQSNISAMGVWINDRYNQPLALDELALCGSKAASPFSFAGFFKGIAYGFRQFIYSFAEDYSGAEEKENSITVWAPTGRDQMQILKDLTNQRFTAQTGITVNYKLIAATALLPAVVAGIGPDVALMCPQNTPINFAMRNAVKDLKGLEGFDDTCEELIKSSLIPYTYEDGVYALPETLTFPIMFYRTDILSELGLEVPQTWDDVTEIIVDLSHNNMQFGFLGSLNNYATILYQNGGKVYTDDGKASALSENIAVEAFKKYTELYSYYKIPVTFEFANRFRSGQMPIAVADYTAYNTLKIFASEIEGLWKIAPVPGTVKEEGSVKHTVVGTSTACMIIANTKKENEAWEFIRWWISSDTQRDYGVKVENKLGPSARYATANSIALKGLPWSGSFYKELYSQMNDVTCIPEVPGGYFTTRHFNNAFRKVIYKSGNPRETLLEYTKEIDREITDKREEFGLDVKGAAQS